LETDFGALHLRGSRQGNGTYPVFFFAPLNRFAVSSSISTDWLYTFRGRLGVALPSNLMAYVTGGLALTRLGVSNSFSDNDGGFGSGSAAKVETGWVVGGGLEWALNNNWSVRAEYLFVDFGKVTANGVIGTSNPAFVTPGAYAQGMNTSADLTANLARGGVNYKF
jgi:outer membrane immunogenic protein